MTLFDSFNENFFWDVARETNFPFYNVGVMEDNEDRFFVQLALAGYDPSKIKVTLDKGILTIEGDKPELPDNVRYVSMGIKQSAFRRRFRLADHVHVEDVAYHDGMLVVMLERRVPDEEKPKVFEVSHKSGSKLLG